ncbi:MAG: class I SAM-dependent methyltransferase [Chlorobium sp.]|jgi:SAM-dependent methyltransferase|nr:class I SAM-dependent methyltransferase [Chlorobium sp.]
MDSDKLSELYKVRFADDQLPRKNAIWRVICQDYLQKFIDPADTVVDIACGYGEFLNNIKAGKKIAVDLNCDAQIFLKPEIEFHQCSATKINSVLVNGSVDVVFVSNFLEHLPDKKTLNDLLDKILVSLKPLGKCIILGPNLRFLPGKYWDFFDHQLGLTNLSLSEALKIKGFSVDVCIDRFLPYSTLGALPTHPFLVKAYLKLPMVWKVLGRQFFIVAHKA